jgi:hypothetical protein
MPSASHGFCAGRLGPMPRARRNRSERKRRPRGVRLGSKWTQTPAIWFWDIFTEIKVSFEVFLCHIGNPHMDLQARNRRYYIERCIREFIFESISSSIPSFFAVDHLQP